MYFLVAFDYLRTRLLMIYLDRIERSKIEETKEYNPLKMTFHGIGVSGGGEASTVPLVTSSSYCPRTFVATDL